MSLTAFVKSFPGVRERFKTEFAVPPLAVSQEMSAAPLSQNYSLVGTAFDYLLRFYIERLNPKSKTTTWVAEIVLDDPDYDTPKFRRILQEAKRCHDEYLSRGAINDKLLRAVLCLAQLDVLYRSPDDSYYHRVGKVECADVEDLQQLISLVAPKMFRAKKTCILNPTFGRASELVGGADCDLVIDDALIEIKTTKESTVRREYFDQLMGYYVLSRIGGIDGAPKGHKIKRLGIYFSRHGHLCMFDVGCVVEEDRLPDLTRWFKKQARQCL